MAHQIASYLQKLNLPSLPFDYEWDTTDFTHFNTFWAVTDEDNPQLAIALQLIGSKAAFALAVACSEWVLARIEGQTDTSDAFLRIEAAWAAAVDPRYATLPDPPSSPPSAPKQFASPLRLAMIVVSCAHEGCSGDGEGIRSSTMGLAMLVDHIARREPSYSSWLSESLRRCHRHYPATKTSVEEEPPVPGGFFDPDFVWSGEAVANAVHQFLETLDPATNPYLRTPEQMLTAGFRGTPYGSGR